MMAFSGQGEPMKELLFSEEQMVRIPQEAELVEKHGFSSRRDVSGASGLGSVGGSERWLAVAA
jgi:hypothetical protein